MKKQPGVRSDNVEKMCPLYQARFSARQAARRRLSVVFLDGIYAHVDDTTDYADWNG